MVSQSIYLALELDYDSNSIWTATSNSDICKWDVIPEAKLTPEFFNSKREEELAKPCNTSYSYKDRYSRILAHASITTNLRLGMTDERVYGGIQNKIKGLPTIKQCKVLANRRNILTKYSNGTIAMFDVFTGEKGNALYLR